MDVVHQTVVRVRYGETDKMGIVYHSNYYVYFEIGRTEFLREMGGMSYKDMEDVGIMMPIIETHCKYFTPAKYDEELIVLTTIKTLTVARMVFTYEIIRKSDKVKIVKGETSLAFVGADGRAINFKKKSKELYEKFLEFTK